MNTSSSRCTRHPIMSHCKHCSLFTNLYILKCNRTLVSCLMCAWHKARRRRKGFRNDAKRWLTKQAHWQIYLPAPVIFLAPNLMCPHQAHFTKQTFFFFHKTQWGMTGAQKHTNTLWPLLMLPSVSKELNFWPTKTLLRLQALFRKFTNVGLWNGHRFCKWTQGDSIAAWKCCFRSSFQNIHHWRPCLSFGIISSSSVVNPGCS